MKYTYRSSLPSGVIIQIGIHLFYMVKYEISVINILCGIQHINNRSLPMKLPFLYVLSQYEVARCRAEAAEPSD